MKVLLIEESSTYRKILMDIFKELERDFEILGFTDSIESTQFWFLNHPSPDLIFLSTNLPDGNSMDLLKEIRFTCPIIFMAEDGKFAQNAFRYLALDYLIRPISRNALISTLYKYKKFQELFTEPGESNPLNSSELMKLSSEKIIHAYKNRFAVHIGDKIKSIPIEEIAYFMADGNIVYLITQQADQYTIAYRLEDIMDKIHPDYFFRINRTFIVRISSIRETRKFFNGRLKLILFPHPPEEDDVFVSRNRVSEFLNWIGE